MARKHKVIALISGGKDSLYSLVHVTALGHEVVALANLYPSSSNVEAQVTEYPAGSCNEVSVLDTKGGEDDDPNSFMYQTAGHTLIPLFSSALHLPLYRYPIVGTAIETGKSYTAHPSDEVESLTHLLRHVISRHPETTAVSSGAIFSNYQRIRVEAVASALKLTSLAYLWQWPTMESAFRNDLGKGSLLSSMQDVGMDARIVKVASGGLDGSHLWLNVADVTSEEKLARTMARFSQLDAGAVIGEGGEFETMALSGPRPLWKRGIVVDREHRKVVDADGGVSYLQFLGGRVEDLENASVIPNIKPWRGMLPVAFDERFDQLWRNKNDSTGIELVIMPLKLYSSDPTPHEHELALLASANSSDQGPSRLLKETANNIILAYRHTHSRETQLTADGSPPEEKVSATPVSSIEKDIPIIGVQKTDPAQSSNDAHVSLVGIDRTRLRMQVIDIIKELHATLVSSNLSVRNVAHVTILLRSMVAFEFVNDLYERSFHWPGPPSRVTMAVGAHLPNGTDLSMSFVISKASLNERDSLHVQSQSYWAPANIGPYSQAVSVPLSTVNEDSGSKVISLAGQIPLLPAEMDLYFGTFRESAIIALQHLWRVGRAMSVHWWTSGIALFTAASESTVHTRVVELMGLWHAIHLRDAEEIADGNLEYQEDEEFDVGDAHLWRPWRPSSNATQNAASSRGKADLLPDWGRTSGSQTPPCFAIQVCELPRNAEVEWTSIGISLGEEASICQDEWLCKVQTNHRTKSSFNFGSIGASSIQEADLLLDDLTHGDKSYPAWEVCVSSRANSALRRRALALSVSYVPCISIWGLGGREMLLVARQIST
ncbi:MAG: hypothetical protein M1828_003901 [Chrysothrix sp. TS-e1954]|nr:MAG: hypothetical protein M1828_003901 [Chrysothrix sp. TS-e1954]